MVAVYDKWQNQIIVLLDKKAAVAGCRLKYLIRSEVFECHGSFLPEPQFLKDKYDCQESNPDEQDNPGSDCRGKEYSGNDYQSGLDPSQEHVEERVQTLLDQSGLAGPVEVGSLQVQEQSEIRLDETCHDRKQYHGNARRG